MTHEQLRFLEALGIDSPKPPPLKILPKGDDNR